MWVVMMKNIIKMIGLFTLIGFSFFYTDKVIEVIREEDKIMVELKSVKDTYYIEAIDANVVSNTIIPGINGRNINLDASYRKMKENGVFNKNLIVYDDIVPKNSLKYHKDKYIILGNQNKQMVSFVFILNSDKYLEDIEKILDDKGIIVNYFVSYSYLVEHSTEIKEIKSHEVYSYGDNGGYTPDNLLFSNNLISRIRKNEAIYCISSNMEDEVLELCSKNDLYTIVPSIVCGTNPYTSVKNNLTSGSIILLSMNQETIYELPTIIDYVKGKGYKISGLSTLLSEELELS